MPVITIFCSVQIYNKRKRKVGGGDSVGGCVVGSKRQMNRTDREEHLKKECES